MPLVTHQGTVISRHALMKEKTFLFPSTVRDTPAGQKERNVVVSGEQAEAWAYRLHTQTYTR